MPFLLLALLAATMFLLSRKEPPAQTIRVKPWGRFRPGERIIILGLPLTGKSRLAAKLMEGADRVVFFDPMRDYASYANATEVTTDDLINKPELLQSPTFRLAVIPDDETLVEDLEETCIMVRAAGNCVFLMDEVGDYRTKGEHIMNKLARNGRHDGIVPIYVSQVAVDIPLTVRRLATRVYSFLQVDKRDIDTLAIQYGREFADGVANAKAHEANIWILPTLRIGRESSESNSTNLPKSSQD